MIFKGDACGIGGNFVGFFQLVAIEEFLCFVVGSLFQFIGNKICFICRNYLLSSFIFLQQISKTNFFYSLKPAFYSNISYTVTNLLF